MSHSQRLEPSDEVDDRHLELAREAGEAYQRAAKYMISEVADVGGLTDEGEYVIGFAVEDAEGMYHLRDGSLEFAEPGESENCHLEVVVAESATGRFLPEATPRATLTDEDGNSVGPERIPFVWHPGLFHYGRNLALPGSGTYTIEVEVGPLRFPRHDERNGDRFAEAVTVAFEDVAIDTGSE